MALIKCPECGKEISDKAEKCIHCGFPINIQGKEGKEKEYALKLNDSMCAIGTEKSVKIFFKGNAILDSETRSFKLNYCSEETDDVGRMQLRVAFSNPEYRDPFKACINVNAQSYNAAKDFVENIAKKYFVPDLVNEWCLINSHVRENASAYSKSTDKEIRKIEDMSHPVEPQKEESFFASEQFTIAMLLIFWPVGLYTMYKYKHFSEKARMIWTIAVIVLVLIALSTWPKIYMQNRIVRYY